MQVETTTTRELCAKDEEIIVALACRGEETDQIKSVTTRHILIRLVGRQPYETDHEITIQVGREDAL